MLLLVHESLNTVSSLETFLQYFVKFWSGYFKIFRNITEIFPRYYIYSGVCSGIKSSNTLYFITHNKIEWISFHGISSGFLRERTFIPSVGLKNVHSKCRVKERRFIFYIVNVMTSSSFFPRHYVKTIISRPCILFNYI